MTLPRLPGYDAWKQRVPEPPTCPQCGAGLEAGACPSGCEREPQPDCATDGDPRDA